MSLSWDDLVKDAGDVASFEPLPEGDYDFQVKEAKATTTKTGKKMFSTTNVVVGGAYNKRQVWDNLVITADNPNALAMFFRKMAALGLTPDYFKTNKPTDEQVCAALKGRNFRAKVGQRTYNGDKRNEISKYYSAPAAAIPGVGMTGAVPPMPTPAPAPAAPAPAPEVQDPWAAAAAVQAAAAQAAAPVVPPAPAPAPAAPVNVQPPAYVQEAAANPAVQPAPAPPAFTAPATEVPATATEPPANPAYAQPAPAAAPSAAPTAEETGTALPPPPPPF